MVARVQLIEILWVIGDGFAEVLEVVEGHAQDVGLDLNVFDLLLDAVSLLFCVFIFGDFNEHFVKFSEVKFEIRKGV